MEANIFESQLVSTTMAKISKIKVVNLRLRAFIGFNDWEQQKRQDLVINFTFKYNAARAVKDDNVDFLVNYKVFTKAIIKLVENQRFLLLETVAERIWELIRRNPYVMEVGVSVEKPYALRFCDNVLVEISDADRYNEALISLGSNIEAEENTKKALEELGEIGTIQKKSAFIYTKPLKFSEQDDFLNGAILLQTKYYYEDLKIKLRTIEAKLKRVRTANKNAPRTIDLDVVTFNSTIVDKELEEFDFLVDFVKELQPELLEK